MRDPEPVISILDRKETSVLSGAHSVDYDPVLAEESGSTRSRTFEGIDESVNWASIHLLHHFVNGLIGFSHSISWFISHCLRAPSMRRSHASAHVCQSDVIMTVPQSHVDP